MSRERPDSDAYRRRHQLNNHRYEDEPEYDAYTEYEDDEDDDAYGQPSRHRPSPPPQRRSYPSQRDAYPPRRPASSPQSSPRLPAQRPASARPPVRRPVPPPERSTLRPVRQRSHWPTFLIGCAIGIVVTVLLAAIGIIYAIHSLTPGGNHTGFPGLSPSSAQFPAKPETQALTITTLAHVLVCDPFGNVTLKVDPNATSSTLTTQKIAYATDQSSASAIWKQLSVSVQQPAAGAAPAACPATQTAQPATPDATQQTPTVPPTSTPALTGSDLMVMVSFPANNATNGTANSVDVTLTLPPTVVQASGQTISVTVKSSQGNIIVDGVSGLLTLTGNGDITAQHLALASTSSLSTNQGKVTFNGFLELPQDASQAFRYTIHGEKGVDVTLPDNINLTLDVSVSSGSITSDFPLSITNSKGSANYHGPLSTGTLLNAKLLLDVGLGNANLHKAPSPT